MSFNIGDTIDDRFQVEGVCSNQGGMGQILFVNDTSSQIKDKIVLKYCKSDDSNLIKRFQKEVKIIDEFKGNSKVLNSIHSNTEFNPPYFVMKYYKQGDLTNLVDLIKIDKVLQEKTFLSMIDCIKELHVKGIFHRDIKPQNFLLDGESIIASDLGLGIKPSTDSTRLTHTNMYAGSQGYIPPEFMEGGFKYADERGDIFMLGKSFYTLLTKRDPSNVHDRNLNPIIFSIIERACHLNKDQRYDNLEQLSQAITTAYNIILGRSVSAYTEVRNLLNDIQINHSINDVKVDSFFQKLSLISKKEKNNICLDLTNDFFNEILEYDINNYLESFLKTYQKMVEDAEYGFVFAETIANNMKAIFYSDQVHDKHKASALELAIRGAYLMNRFHAMDTCSQMIKSVSEENLGLHVSAVIMKNSDTFIENIEASECQCDSVINSISAIQGT